MSMENIRELFLEDETFEDARQKFNTVLQRLFRSMIDTESNDGSITLKMDVSMQTEFIPNHVRMWREKVVKSDYRSLHTRFLRPSR